MRRRRAVSGKRGMGLHLVDEIAEDFARSERRVQLPAGERRAEHTVDPCERVGRAPVRIARSA